ncbi:hypothetical protein [Agarilytica rhodophyticola]|uniref:hypothetical protein n=1 Tax=Agarilytica rhodophyticola TaxID=1737490 RepID=UPI000B3438AB|nr:hypothetical protein [Agarilytica rhodophyticola]
MNEAKGAMTVVEGNPDWKADVSLVLNNARHKRNVILRTTLDRLGLWKSKHNKNVSPFKSSSSQSQKQAAIIDNEVWVFDVDATRSSDIVAAVKIAMNYYKVSADVIIKDVYTKNLNAECEHKMTRQALVEANKGLYFNTSKALVEAAKTLGVSGTLNFWVFSNNKNYKIPREDLHQSFINANAFNVTTDTKRHIATSASNDATRLLENAITHLHLASFNL